MAELRVYGSSATSSGTALHVYASRALGAAVSTPRLRVYKSAATGTSTPAVGTVSRSATLAEPGSLVTLTANLAPSSPTPTTWTWTQTAGPAGVITGSGSTVTFRCPSVMPPTATVTVRVVPATATATGAGVSASFDVLPQTSWSRVHGGAWVGAS